MTTNLTCLAILIAAAYTGLSLPDRSIVCTGAPPAYVLPDGDCVSHPTRPDFEDLCTEHQGDVMPVWDDNGNGRWVAWN